MIKNSIIKQIIKELITKYQAFVYFITGAKKRIDILYGK